MFKANDLVCVLIPNTVSTGYDYRLNEPAGLGQFVLVSVMNRAYVGVVVGPGHSGLPPEKIKPVLRVYRTGMENAALLGPSAPAAPAIGLSGADLAWIYKMADWTMMAPGAVLKLILNIPDAFDAPRTDPLYAYIEPDKKIRMTDRRLAIADAFAMNDNEPMTAHDIQNIARVSPAVVKSMVDRGCLTQVGAQSKSSLPDLTYYDTGTVTLNQEQRTAADAMDLTKFGVHVLDGITGSGKTQVYFDMALRAYQRGKSVLLMMPEIALTAQFMSRFQGRFGGVPIVWHSNLTGARRRAIWRGVAAGDIRIAVGTRSALFLPWRDLGLIIVDEEHDGSYKQEDMGNYHARDMAILRGKIADFPIVLASATPSAETVKNIQTGNYTCSKLVSRFGGATLPTIKLIDMRSERKRESDQRKIDGIDYDPARLNALSPSLAAAISETLATGQQVMLFINRRGFAPVIQCKKCGWIAQCPDCSVGMVYHRAKNSLLCHTCGRAAPIPKACPECGNAELSFGGTGIEKIEAEVHAKFPAAKTAVVSSDTTQSRQALERLVSQMETGDIDLIIGTQILAKGHHFPNLTLVGVIDADMGLFGTDFRSGEKTFQQLFQVAGRAGRGEIPGRVMLQTYQPDHPVLRAIAAGDRDALMAMDLDGRRAAGMPPYGRLVALIVTGMREEITQKFCADLAMRAPAAPGIRVFGPIPAQIYQIRNWYRMRFLVVAPEKAKIQDFVAHWLRGIKIPANVKLKIDVNPMNFM
jgi:primosomal protein N' (replication factor Y)